MDEYEVVLLPAAYGDLDEIINYIMVDNPRAAEMILDQIMHSLQRLNLLPYSGSPLLETTLKNFNFRMVIINPYLAFYRVIEKKVYVYRILHGARDYLQLLKNEIE